MNSSDPRTVSAMVRRERARGRLRAATAGVGVLGVAIAGGLAFILPGTAHSTASGSSAAKPATSTSGSSSSGTASGSSRSSSSSGTSSSSSGIQSSSSAPSSSSGAASATSGGS